jgi:signal transduction histidine kinase
LGGAGAVLFSRSVDEEMAALPTVRRGALLAGLLTLVLALGVGSLVAMALARPVRALAEAAGRVAEGDFEAPVPASRLDEVDRLGTAFRSMRESLKSRLQELADVNRELEERQERLHELQAELIRQDRVASSARMAAELAHEIRNPVANVRNCLEVVRRGLPEESEGARFADMAIDELLRMHELAEHLLDLNRPADPGVGTCDAGAVAGQVATLAGVGHGGSRVTVSVAGDDRPAAAIPPDALKQILFNLVDNAREAAGSGGHVEIRVGAEGDSVTVDVLDTGPGMSAEVLPHVFDPFFTTKDAVSGVGLGLSVAQGLARRHGGRMEASNRSDVAGARFRVEVPRARGTGA